MTDLFYTVLHMSGYGLVAALAVGVILVLFYRTRCSKTALLLLWLVAAFRLLCPWSPPSPVSLFNWTDLDRYASQPVTAVDHIYTGDAQRAVDADNWSREEFEQAVSAGVEPVRNPSTGLWEVHYYENETGKITPAKSVWETYSPVLTGLWLAGGVGLLAYGAVSYGLLRRRLRFAVKDEALPGVWYSDRIASPCVAGLFRPQVYLTFGMTEEEKAYVLAHERQHVKTGDHLWKILGWLIMCVHWFNPLLWVCYRAFLWTLEEACDQRVLRQVGEEKKADYGQALLSLSSGRRFRLGPSPIAFGEGDTKGRVKTILKYQKPLLWLTAVAVVVAALVGVSVLTSASGGGTSEDGQYQVSGLIHQTYLSSLSPEGFLERWRGSRVIYTPERFYLEKEDLDVADPIYEEMELGVDLLFIDTGNDDFDKTMNIELPEGAKGFRVLTAGGQETGFHVLEVGGRIWVGKWVTHGTFSKVSEYWYIVEASLTSAAGTAYGALSDGLVVWSLAPQGSAIFPGFPFTFDVDGGDRIEVSCDGGSLYVFDGDAYEELGNRGTLSDVGTIYWSPYFGGERLKQADVAFTLYKENKELLTGTILIRPDIADVEDILNYYARASLSNGADYAFSYDPDTGGGLITGQMAAPEDPGSFLDAPLAVWQADLTHDGVDETITVTGDGYVFYMAVTDSGGQQLWAAEAATAHMGQNGVYLCQLNGQYYLLQWQPYSISGTSSLGYKVFSLTAQGEERVLAQDSIYFESEDFMAVDVEAYRTLETAINYYLSQSIVLLSTNEDAGKGETGRYQCYSTPDHILTPILDRTQWGYGTYPSSDDFARLQALAQGTYTFTGEVLPWSGEDCIAVVDQSLWCKVPIGNEYYGQYYFFIPVDDPSAYQEGDIVQVTADGPLYRNQLPDAGTRVQVALIRPADEDLAGLPSAS